MIPSHILKVIQLKGTLRQPAFDKKSDQIP